MSRRAQAPRRSSLPDPKYGNAMLAKFINMVMKSGKKSVAEKIVYGALERMSERVGNDKSRAIEMLEPGARQHQAGRRGEVPPRRRRHVSGAGRSPRRRAARRSRCAGRSRPRARAPRRAWPMRLAHELIDAAENRGAAVKKREDTHRMADANSAFAHYRW